MRIGKNILANLNLGIKYLIAGPIYITSKQSIT